MQNLGLRVWGLGFLLQIEGSTFGVRDSGYRVYGTSSLSRSLSLSSSSPLPPSLICERNASSCVRSAASCSSWGLGFKTQGQGLANGNGVNQSIQFLIARGAEACTRESLNCERNAGAACAAPRAAPPGGVGCGAGAWDVRLVPRGAAVSYERGAPATCRFGAWVSRRELWVQHHARKVASGMRRADAFSARNAICAVP